MSAHRKRRFFKRRRRELSGRKAFAEYLRRIGRHDGAGRPSSIEYEYIEAPEILSFVRNAEEVSSFIRKLRECFDRKSPAFVVLKSVTQIDYDGITVLLSVVIRFKSQQIHFNGNFPTDKKVRATLEESGFFSYLTRTKLADKDRYSLSSKSSIYTHASRTVDSELGESIIASSSQTVWGAARRCPGLQRTFIELMQNTNNHASLEGHGEKHWWLSVKHVENENKVAFSFVDYGVGIFVNLRNKRAGNKFYKIFETLFDLFSFSGNSEVLQLIFQGELHRTASQKPYRGKGLPGIFEAFRRGALSNFTLITNDVYYTSNGDEYRTLRNPFQGTFVYWELMQHNLSLPA